MGVKNKYVAAGALGLVLVVGTGVYSAVVVPSINNNNETSAVTEVLEEKLSFESNLANKFDNMEEFKLTGFKTEVTEEKQQDETVKGYSFTITGDSRKKGSDEYSHGNIEYSISEYSYEQLAEVFTGINTSEIDSSYLNESKNSFTLIKKYDSKGVFDTMSAVISRDTTTIKDTTFKVLQESEGAEVEIQENATSFSYIYDVSEATINEKDNTVEYIEKVLEYANGTLTEIVRKVSVPLTEELKENPQAVFSKSYNGAIITVISETKKDVTVVQESQTQTEEAEGPSM